MSKTIRILSIVLVLQIILIGALTWEQDRETPVPPKALLNFDSKEVDHIVISTSKTNKVELAKTKNGWTLPGYHDLPADQEMIRNLMKRLLQIKPGWPVAKTSESAERFKVGDQDYQRSITLQQSGKTVAQLLLGSSPGLRKVHARVPGDDRVFEIAFSQYEAPAKQEGWLDKMLLAFKQAPDVIQGKDFVIRKNKEIWTLDDAQPDEKLDQKKVTSIVNQLKDLTVIEVVDKVEPETLKSAVTIQVQQGATKKVLTYLKREKDYLVHMTGYPEYFKTFAASAAKMSMLNRASLLLKNESEKKPGRKSKP